MSSPMTNKQALTDESARESGNILLIVAARMARRELFTPLHCVSELPQKVVSMRTLREALERSEETLQREVCKIVDGHDRMAKKVKEAEEKLQAAEKRIAELEAREVTLPELKMLSDYLREVTMREREDILLGVKLEFHRKLQAAGIRINGEG